MFQQINLHLIGKLQTNKVKFAIKIFDYIHSVDSTKLAKKIFDEQIKQNKRVKIFIQVNIGSEEQKSGVEIYEIGELLNFCKKLNLDVVGFMCIPPLNQKSSIYFKKMNSLNISFNLQEISINKYLHKKYIVVFKEILYSLYERLNFFLQFLYLYTLVPFFHS